MATFKSKQLNPNLTGSFAVSGSFGVTGPLTATTFVGMLSSSAQIASDITGKKLLKPMGDCDQFGKRPSARLEGWVSGLSFGANKRAKKFSK